MTRNSTSSNAAGHHIIVSNKRAGCMGALDAGASRSLAGSEDGSLGKWCEGFDHDSRLPRQRLVVACPTIALHEAMDVLVRAPLRARLAVAEGLHDLPSLINNNVVDPELLVGKRDTWSFSTSVCTKVTIHSIQEWFWCAVRAPALQTRAESW